MKHILIVNPAANKGRAKNFIEPFKKVCIEKEFDFEIVETKYEGHATSIVKHYAHDKKDHCVIYSAGGDGTLNEIANGIAGSLTATLAVLPGGSGNDFYKTAFGEQTDDYEGIIREVIDSNDERIDYGVINNEKVFTNIASVAGLDAIVANEVNEQKNKGLMKNKMIYKNIYYLILIKNILTFKAPKLEIELGDGTKIPQKVTIVTICNGKYYGNGIPISPNSELNDGKFDVCIADETPRLKILALLQKVMKGEHLNLPEIHFYQTDYVKVKCCDGSAYCNIDGEIIDGEEFEFALKEGAMKTKKRK